MSDAGEPGCRFCALIRGETPAHVIFADGISLAPANWTAKAARRARAKAESKVEFP